MVRDPIEEEFLWMARYPFHPLTRERVFGQLQGSIEDLEEFYSDAVSRLGRALAGEKPVLDENPHRSLVVFYTTVLLVKYLDNWLVERRFVEYEAERAYNYLRMADTDEILKVFKGMGIDLKIVDKRYGVYFRDYIQATRDLPPNWKMIYFPMERGYVYLNKKSLARIGKEVFKDEIIKTIESVESVPSSIGEAAKVLVEAYSDILERLRPQATSIQTRDVERFPPCMKYLYANIGKGLPHPGRFTIVTFLHKMGFTVDEIISLFARTPDFNERVTRYQVEHILGMRGGKIKYDVPSCRKIKSFGFCFPDEICVKHRIRHPLTYVKKVARIGEPGGS